MMAFLVPSKTSRLGSHSGEREHGRAAGFRNRQSAPMFLRLKYEPKKTALFHILPVKSAQATKMRRLP